MVGFDRDRFDYPASEEAGVPTTLQLEHLLRVAASVTRDANTVWADLWAAFKPHVTPGGVIGPEMTKGFVPECGWPEFMEKLWLLKHYIDSIDRICKNKH